MKQKGIWISVLLSTLMVLGCGEADEATQEEGAGISVAVHTVGRALVSLRHVASGTLRGSQTAVLTSKAPGYVQEIRFTSGDAVRAGQVLFVLEDAELGAKLRAAQAGLEEARQALMEAESGLTAAEAGARVAAATYERFQTLKEKRAVAPQEFDEVEGSYTAATAQKQMAEARLRRVQSSLQRAEAEVEAVKSYTQVIAPFAGRVTERRVDVGNLAAPGTPLAVIEQEGALRAEVSVPESQAGRIHVGDFTEVWLEGANDSLRGRVSEVFQGVDVATRAFMVQVDLPEDLSDLTGVYPRTGMFVRVEFTVGQTESMLIPSSAVVKRGQLEMVYVVEEDRARLRLVTLGRPRGSRIEVLSGLSDGDAVISEVVDSLREGQRVVTQ